MKIDLSPAVQRHLENCPDASVEVLQMKSEASYFARCLLMPEDFVKKWWLIIQRQEKKRFFFFTPKSNYYTTYRNIKIIAKMFAVPVEEMEYRLRELGLSIEYKKGK